MKAYTNQTARILSDGNNQVVADVQNPFYIDDLDEDLEPVTTWEEDADKFEDPDTYDEYIGARVQLPHDEEKIK